MEVVVTGHNFESILPKNHPCHVCFKLADWFQKRRLLNNFPIGSHVKTMSADSVGEGGDMPTNPLACSDSFAVLTGDTWAPTFRPGLPVFKI
jgi:hypothetical protein